MKPVIKDDLVVARKAGQRLFLSGTARSGLTFQGMGEKTLFFRTEEFDEEIKRLGVSPSQIVKTPVELVIRTKPA